MTLTAGLVAARPPAAACRSPRGAPAAARPDPLGEHQGAAEHDEQRDEQRQDEEAAYVHAEQCRGVHGCSARGRENSHGEAGDEARGPERRPVRAGACEGPDAAQVADEGEGDGREGDRVRLPGGEQLRERERLQRRRERGVPRLLGGDPEALAGPERRRRSAESDGEPHRRGDHRDLAERQAPEAAGVAGGESRQPAGAVAVAEGAQAAAGPLP